MTALVPPAQWAVYAEFIAETTRRGIPFAVGGGLAVSAYSDCVRNTKDMDIYIMEQHSAEVMAISRELRFTEYTAVPYDPTWSYRSFRDGYILDFLWKMLNGRTSVDETWVTRGWELTVRGSAFRLLPVEELIWSKLYILRNDRADWPDIISLLYARGAELEWDRLLADLGEDRLLLGGVVGVLRWLCPGHVCRFPDSIWAPLGLVPPWSDAPEIDRDRVALMKGEHLFPGGLP
ncbi:nucleotidyltransferase [Geomonas paludis]|uniref:Nucleotidyltransferase n=1 Tax=Geomonas paludis TaxID=2740185 RepID=A0ABY4LC29_9BACT|nr:nucleotidyltransferase [Geomonas paludis]UPU35537.1 nucleotidyltransferase [Geomonas paludis]